MHTFTFLTFTTFIFTPSYQKHKMKMKVNEKIEYSAQKGINPKFTDNNHVIQIYFVLFHD